ncbi:MAG: glycerophosphodiester phosphodiesterase, partial [Alphaproteobacteria bacterium]|nr:glycerophosphodiester phosphodiesterase [Alphaproteobacteria bacterium]
MSIGKPVKIIGHRGGRNVWPENGLTGFRNVIALGVEGVEFDVHPSADGELFVIHDATLDRTTVAQGPVVARTAAELRRIALKDGKGDCVPTLDQVLDVLGPPGFDLHVEIKLDALGKRYPGIEARVLDRLKRRGLAEQAVVTCFAPEVLVELRRLAPRQRLLASINQRWAD